MQRAKTRIAAATIAAGLACVALPAVAQTCYTIDGQAAPYDVRLYMAKTGLPAGDYRLDAQGYCGVIGNSQSLRSLHAGSFVSRHGGGEQGSNGWSHYDYDNMSGTWVGGDSNGCYYSGDWPHC